MTILERLVMLSFYPFLYVDDVKAFHDKFELVTPIEFCKLEPSLHRFRTNFFVEELTEFKDAVRDGDFETVLDSLIDLIYIISGAALLHGIQSDELERMCVYGEEFFSADKLYIPSDDEASDLPGPGILVAREAERFCVVMDSLIEVYDSLHADITLSRDEERLYVSSTLAGMLASCVNAANACHVNDPLWFELWNDVQRANMSKERAKKASDSKRGSTWDVVKPAGWVGPQTAAIIAKHK